MRNEGVAGLARRPRRDPSNSTPVVVSLTPHAKALAADAT